MNRNEAERLVRQCLLAMKQAGESVEEDDEITGIKITSLCRLWAGMGFVYNVSFGNNQLVIVKRVSPMPKKQRQSIGDRRKADSYQAEANFYESLAEKLICDAGLQIPRPYYVERGGNDQVTICMSKLAGRPANYMDENKTYTVLRWLATLHAATWGDLADEAVQKHGLQPVGTYWHLDTRPDEHESMRRSKGWQGRLYHAARAVDERLKRDKMQCCVHGDAKEANMLFMSNGSELQVAMYDFQYCGKGPPTKDLAYFLCVAADDNDEEYLEYYHKQLLQKLAPEAYKPSLSELNESLQLAYCDWARFMCGWGFWGVDLSREVIAVLDRLDGGIDLGSEEAYEEAVRREFG